MNAEIALCTNAVVTRVSTDTGCVSVNTEANRALSILA